jgi:protein-L-isoaspartate(D-aspartate) O-methyltransferase
MAEKIEKVRANKRFDEIKERIIKTIRKVKDTDFRNLLTSVFANNEDHLTPQNISNFEKIMDAMSVVDRKYFTDYNCYVDEPMVIGHGQTISQPTTVARMLLMAGLEKKDSVLEAGTGSGWNAALMAQIVNPGKVVTTERIHDLAKIAEKNIKTFIKKAKRKINVEVILADILDENAEVWKNKYHKIVVTAGVSYDNLRAINTMAVKLLKDNGMIIFPSSETGSYGALELWQKKGNELKRIEREEGYAFVPLLRKVQIR